MTAAGTKTEGPDDPFDAVLLIAFGGPERLAEVRPFIARVLAGRPVPAERFEEVVSHYEQIGGRSPLNELTFAEAQRLRRRLKGRGYALPVHVGMRNSAPFLADTLRTMGEQGLRRVAGVILSAQRNDASWDRYHRDIAAARTALGDAAPKVGFVPGWYDHPHFIAAQAGRVREALKQIPAPRRACTRVLFTAHSIPSRMAAACSYERELSVGAALVAERLGGIDYRIAYQSRSGSPRDPWLEPDITAALREEAAAGCRDVVVVPFGFVCDHVEVLYDLDVDARRAAESAGLNFVRAATVSGHPDFTEMLADVVLDYVA